MVNCLCILATGTELILHRYMYLVSTYHTLKVKLIYIYFTFVPIHATIISFFLIYIAYFTHVPLLFRASRSTASCFCNSQHSRKCLEPMRANAISHPSNFLFNVFYWRLLVLVCPSVEASSLFNIFFWLCFILHSGSVNLNGN